MARWTPDPTFYPTPADAMRAPAEKLAYVEIGSPDDARRIGFGS